MLYVKLINVCMILENPQLLICILKYILYVFLCIYILKKCIKYSIIQIHYLYSCKHTLFHITIIMKIIFDLKLTHNLNI